MLIIVQCRRLNLSAIWYVQKYWVMPKNLTMKLRSFFYTLVASVVVLLLIGGSVFVWIAAHNPLTLLQGRQLIPETAMFVSRQAPVMVSLLVNPDRLEAFRQVVASPQTRRQSRAEFKQLRQNLTASLGLDYQTDIQPWLGEEITFAVTTLDADRQSENGQQPGYLLALDIRDPEQSRAFLQRFWQTQALAGRSFTSEQYQGVELTYPRLNLPQVKQAVKSNQSIDPGKSNSGLKISLATAKVGDRFILLANHPKVLRQAINTVQAPDLGLTSTTQYKKALANLQQGRVGFTFLSLPQLLAWNSPYLPVSSSSYPNSLAIGLGLNRRGLLAETVLISATKADANPTGATSPLSQPVQALQYLPADTPLAASGTALNQLWTQISTALPQNDLTTKLVNQPLENLKTRWGLDLPQDIFAWVKGEYAVAMVPRSLEVPNSQASRPDWLFVAERTEPEMVRSAMEHLDATAKQQGLGARSLALEGQEILAWTRLITAATDSAAQTLRNPSIAPKASPTLPESSADILQAQVLAARAEAGNYEILATSLGAMSQALESQQNSLINSNDFKQAIAPLPQTNNGYLYLNWVASRSLLEQQFPLLRAVEILGKPLFGHLRSLTLSSYSADAGAYRSQLFIELKS